MNRKPNAPLLQCNTLALQATASVFVRAADEITMHEALTWARTKGLAVLPLGEGSNVVLAGDVDALVLQVGTRGIEELDRTSEHVVVKIAAGEPWHALVEWALQQGFYGLENLALIPGNVGAAPIQNIGAYGVELQQFLHRVHALRIDDGSALTLANAECAFGYRDSIFKRELRDKVVITSVELALPLTPSVNTAYPALSEAVADICSDGGLPTPRQVFDAVVALRRSKLPDPRIEPNAGSFFKNPVVPAAKHQALLEHSAAPGYPQPDGRVKIPAAWLIDQCGWKGKRRDEQGVHPQHALVLVNYGNSSGKALLGMAREISDDVNEQFGIALEIEPRVYGATQ